MSKKRPGRLLAALMISMLSAGACTSTEDSEGVAKAMREDGKAETVAASPASLDQGRWKIARVGGKAAASDSDAWLEIDLTAGRITGNAGCNNFFASFEGTAEAVTMGPVGGTKKMCPGEPMVQETAVYAILAGVSRMYIDGEGQLVLEGSTGKLVASSAR